MHVKNHENLSQNESKLRFIVNEEALIKDIEEFYFQTLLTKKIVKDPITENLIKFDKNFYKLLPPLSNKANKKAVKMRPKTKKLKKKQNNKKNLRKGNFVQTKLIILFRTLHFFNYQNKLINCLYCKKPFTTNGLGGHMSKCQKNVVKKYTIRKKIKDNLRIEKIKRTRFCKLYLKKNA